MTWHWRVSTGHFELANRRPDRTVVYLNKGDQLPLRELDHTERLAACSCRSSVVLPILRIGNPVNLVARQN